MPKVGSGILPRLVLLLVFLLAATSCAGTHHLYDGAKRSLEELALISTGNCVITHIDDKELPDPNRTRAPNKLALLPGEHTVIVSGPLFAEKSRSFVGGRMIYEYVQLDQHYTRLTVSLDAGNEYRLYAPVPHVGFVSRKPVSWDLELENLTKDDVILKTQVSRMR